MRWSLASSLVSRACLGTVLVGFLAGHHARTLKFTRKAWFRVMVARTDSLGRLVCPSQARGWTHQIGRAEVCWYHRCCGRHARGQGRHQRRRHKSLHHLVGVSVSGVVRQYCNKRGTCIWFLILLISAYRVIHKGHGDLVWTRCVFSH